MEKSILYRRWDNRVFNVQFEKTDNVICNRRTWAKLSSILEIDYVKKLMIAEQFCPQQHL